MIVRKEVVVGVAPQQAFATFTDRIGEWWPLATHALTDGPRGVAFTGGRLVETAADGTEHEWGKVLAWEPPHRLAYSWHLGRDTATEVEVTFAAHPEGTRVTVEHRGFEVWGDDARASYERGWPGVLEAYAEAT